MKKYQKLAIILFFVMVSCQTERRVEVVVTTIINKQVGDGNDGIFNRYGLVALSNGETLYPDYGVYSVMNLGDTVTITYRMGQITKVDCSCIVKN